MDILQQTACIVVNQTMADNFTSLFNCMVQNDRLQHRYSASNCMLGFNLIMADNFTSLFDWMIQNERLNHGYSEVWLHDTKWCYNMNNLQQTVCVADNLIMADNFTSLFNCIIQNDRLQHGYSLANCMHGC